MKRTVLIAIFCLLPTTALADHLVLQGGFYLRDVAILVNQGGLVQFSQGSGGPIWTMPARYVERTVQEEPQGMQELKPKELQQYLSEMRRQEVEMNTLAVKNIEEAAQLYFVNRKDPYLALALTFPIPTLGHVYAGDWTRGAPFILYEALPIVIGLWPTNDRDFKNYQALIITFGYLIFKGLEMYDAAMAAEDYNQSLKKRLRIEVLPEEQGLGMRLKFQF